MKIVLDTNVVIAGFASRGLCESILELCLDSHRIVLSEELLDEIERNLSNKIKLPAGVIDEIIKLLVEHGDILEPASFIGTPTKLVATMVVDKINQAGGVNGRPIELIVGDTEGDPAKAVNIAKKSIYKEKVAAFIGPTRTGTGMAVKKIIHEGKVPAFMTVGGDPVIMGGPKLGPNGFLSPLNDPPWRSSASIRI